MNILTLLKRGAHHQNFNEDFVYSHSLTKDIFVCAVMDGCSSAKDSHFTSSLYAKSLHKSVRMLPKMKEIVEDFDLEKMDLEAISEFFMNQLFDDLKRAKKLFFLEVEEVLSTIVLLVYDHKKKTASITMSGDGLFCINNEITEIDQNNIPNFLGYHLHSNFQEIKKSEIQTWFFEDVSDVSISTDGIDKLLVNSKRLPVGFNPRKRFLVDKPIKTEDSFFEEQYESFMRKGFVLHDDISIIRLINNS